MTTPEADPADLAEQQAVVAPVEQRLDTPAPLEADDLDAAEQAVAVEDDDDERR